MRWSPSWGVLALLLAACTHSCRASADSEVIRLTEGNFNAQTKQGAWLITVSVAR